MVHLSFTGINWGEQGWWSTSKMASSLTSLVPSALWLLSLVIQGTPRGLVFSWHGRLRAVTLFTWRPASSRKNISRVRALRDPSGSCKMSYDLALKVLDSKYSLLYSNDQASHYRQPRSKRRREIASSLDGGNGLFTEGEEKCNKRESSWRKVSSVGTRTRSWDYKIKPKGLGSAS